MRRIVQQPTTTRRLTIQQRRRPIVFDGIWNLKAEKGIYCATLIDIQFDHGGLGEEYFRFIWRAEGKWELMWTDGIDSDGNHLLFDSITGVVFGQPDELLTKLIRNIYGRPMRGDDMVHLGLERLIGQKYEVTVDIGRQPRITNDWNILESDYTYGPYVCDASLWLAFRCVDAWERHALPYHPIVNKWLLELIPVEVSVEVMWVVPEPEEPTIMVHPSQLSKARRTGNVKPTPNS